jgi:hypothetical protein
LEEIGSSSFLTGFELLPKSRDCEMVTTKWLSKTDLKDKETT